MHSNETRAERRIFIALMYTPDGASREQLGAILCCSGTEDGDPSKSDSQRASRARGGRMRCGRFLRQTTLVLRHGSRLDVAVEPCSCWL